LSIYYFWGELAALKVRNAHNRRGIVSQGIISAQHQSPVGSGRTLSETDKIKPRRELPLPTREATRHSSSSDSTGRRKRSAGVSLGNGKVDRPIQAQRFMYHGTETSPPPEDIALAYARRLPLTKGLPGPSYTWSAFAANPDDAVSVMRTGRIVPLVTERMDESLVVAAHHLGWSLADVVVVVPRKVDYHATLFCTSSDNR
jgi:hypothetical protein